VIFEFKN